MKEQKDTDFLRGLSFNSIRLKENNCQRMGRDSEEEANRMSFSDGRVMEFRKKKKKKEKNSLNERRDLCETGKWILYFFPQKGTAIAHVADT